MAGEPTLDTFFTLLALAFWPAVFWLPIVALAACGVLMAYDFFKWLHDLDKPPEQRARKKTSGRPLRIAGVAIGLFCAGVGAAVVAYWVKYPAYTHRMKVFIDIEEGDEVRSGSGVIEVTWQFQPAIGPGATCRLEGDAIAVQLRSGPVLAVLYQYRNEYLPIRSPVDQTRVGFCNMALLAYGLGIQQSHSTLQALASKSGRVQVPPRGLPSFVVFSDPRVPSSARLVFDKEFPNVFGPGVRLRGVSLELTNEPITRGAVERVVPAVATVLARKDKGRTAQPGHYAPNPSDFSQGEKK